MTRVSAALIAAASLLALCAGCGSGGDSVDGNPPAIPVAGAPSSAPPRVRIFNAVPSAGSLAVSVTERPASSSPSTGETSRLLHEIAFKELTARDSVQAGRPTFSIADSASGETLALQILTLLRGASYTLALVGRLPANPETPTSTGVTGLLLADDVVGPPYGAGRLRIVIALPSSKQYDVYFMRPGSDIQAAKPTFASLTYKQYTAYLDLPVDNYRVVVTEAGSKTAVAAEYRAVLPDGGLLAALPLHSRQSATLVLIPSSPSADAAEIALLPDHD